MLTLNARAVTERSIGSLNRTEIAASRATSSVSARGRKRMTDGAFVVRTRRETGSSVRPSRSRTPATALNTTIDFAGVGGKRVGAFFLDIDNFKTLNDSMGHPYGDRVLIAIARRLEAIANQMGLS
jgi:predicted signal transduction protein with EAL and GGDEF domain